MIDTRAGDMTVPDSSGAILWNRLTEGKGNGGKEHCPPL